jgi:glycosyltransferase involved in cell wall biosynthesis
MDASPTRDWPPVSVIMPVLDEERHLADAVAGVLAQDYPGELELVLALGPSQDRTGEIPAGLAAADGRVRLVDNPAGRTPDGLNAAIKTVRYGIVVRVDGHGVLSPGYIKVAVDALDRTGPARRTSAASCGLKGGHRLRAGGRPGDDVPAGHRRGPLPHPPRSSVRALAGQFFRTGQWRREVVRRHPHTANLRYLAALRADA